MFEFLLIAAVTVGCVSGPRNRQEAAQPDTVAIMLVAFHHHYPDLRLDSVALDVDDQPPREVELTKAIATRLERPVVRLSEVLWCETEMSVPRHCGLTGFKRLIKVHLESLEAGRAVVVIGSSVEADSHVWGEATAYELKRVDSEWVVTKALWHSAT